MLAYLLRRLLGGLPVLLGAALLIFGLLRVVPGDVAAAMLGPGAETGSPVVVAQLEKLRAALYLDRPLHEQLGIWLWQAAQGNLGQSYWTNEPVLRMLGRALPVTLELAALSLLISVAIALPIGVLSALRQDSWQDYAGRLFSIGFLSVPDFWIGTMMILLPLWWFRWIPPVTFVAFDKDPAQNLLHLWFPSLALGLSTSSSLVRMLRSSLLEVLRQDYIRTARAKGLRETLVVVRHALRNALIPVVTLLGVRVGRLLGGTVVMEHIFGLPGVGRLLIDGIAQRDYPLVQALVLFFALVFIVVNLAVDLTYAALDPRIRYA